MVLNFDGDRAFVSHMPPRPGASSRRSTAGARCCARTRPRWCYLHAGPGMPEFLREARELGAKIALDMSLGDERYAGTRSSSASRLADVFVPNEDELIGA